MSLFTKCVVQQSPCVDGFCKPHTSSNSQAPRVINFRLGLFFVKNFKKGLLKNKKLRANKIHLTLGISEVFLKRSERKIWEKKFCKP